MKLDIAKPAGMVVMRVGQDETVDLPGAGCKQLTPQVRRRVYEDVLSSADQHRTARPLELRLQDGLQTGRAVAEEGRHPSGSACPEKRQCMLHTCQTTCSLPSVTDFPSRSAALARDSTSRHVHLLFRHPVLRSGPDGGPGGAFGIGLGGGAFGKGAPPARAARQGPRTRTPRRRT